LRKCAAQCFGRFLRIGLRGNRVENFGQNDWEIGVIGAYDNPPSLKAALQQPAGIITTNGRAANLERQVYAKAKDCHAAVRRLAATFGCFGLHAARLVSQTDGRFNLVAMLAAGPRASLTAHVALLQKRIVVKRGGMFH
jgi:hypothetical protein